VGERGEPVFYIGGDRSPFSVGLRELQSDQPHDRYALGLHHLAFTARSREVVDERAAWLRERQAEIESGPEEYPYSAGYYAVFFYDPDGLKLEIVTAGPTH
jgi:catechol 2,3-dioxygenase-like lactoylglutathione lyase family enzyme